MRGLQGKVAVITGGNSGIGLAAARRLHEEGARVAISGRDQKTLDEAAASIGKDVLAVRANVSKLAEIDALFAAVAARLGKIDVLFVNAGIVNFVPLAEVTEQIYDQQFDINTKGAYFTVQKALPHLNEGASVILNTSVASHKGTVNGTVYAATKAAMRSFARTMAAELAPRKIRVNAVAPGPIGTPILQRAGLSEERIAEFTRNILATVPMKRFGTPEEVAGAVAFLASSDSTYITGLEMDVGGGRGQT